MSAKITVYARLCAGLLALAGNAQAEVRVERSESLVLGLPSRFQVGDRLLSYRQAGETLAQARELDSPMAARMVFRTELQRQPLTLRVARGDDEIDIELAAGTEELSLHSELTPAGLPAVEQRWQQAISERAWPDSDRLYAEAVTLATPTEAAYVAWLGAEAAWRQSDYQKCRQRIAEGHKQVQSELMRIVLNERDMHCVSFLGDWRVARQMQIDSLAVLKTLAPNTLMQARLQAMLAQIESFSDAKAALIEIEQAVAQGLATCGRCRDQGMIFQMYGDVLANLNRYGDAAAAYAESVAIARAVDSPYVVAGRLRPQARSLRLLGRLDEAEALLREALALLEKTEAPRDEYGAFYNGLGVIATFRGDFLSAGQHFRQALELASTFQTESVDIANARQNLAWTLAQAGDLQAAERETKLSTAIMRRQVQGVNLANSLVGYADIESARGDLDAALRLIDEAIALHLSVNEQSQDLAQVRIKQALLLQHLGRQREAERAWQQAIAILETLPADNFVLAAPLTERGFADLRRGDHDQAAKHFERALTLFRTQAKDSLDMARALLGAGQAALAQHRLADADTLFQGALRIRERNVPDTAAHAEALHALGRLAEARGESAAAQGHYCGASDMLDHASLKVGTDLFAQSRFRALFAEIYRDCVLANIDLGAPASALEALERSRARGFRADLDALTINLAAENEALTRANEASLGTEVRQQARLLITRLRVERQALQDRLARNLPMLAALDRRQLQAKLGADEAYLAFAIGERRGAALLLLPDGQVLAHTLNLDAQAMARQVKSLRELITQVDRPAEWRSQSADVRRQLLGPLGAALEPVKTLLISPDGPLHDLPFAALWMPESKTYWIERHELAIVDTLSARPTERVAPTAVTSLLAVGDPRGKEPSEAEFGLALRRAGIESNLPALPAARREVRHLAQRYADQTQALIGAQATEASVRAGMAEADVIHFAVHALLDREQALESTLVLAPGSTTEADNDGFLRVHEILSDLRLHADLVVLSACDTGLGKELAGEGLIGFARAFALAGGGSTLASLWPVADESTADLMAAFYAARDTGLGHSAALRVAMRTQMQTGSPASAANTKRGIGGLRPREEASTTARHPYYWAAFQVYGNHGR